MLPVTNEYHGDKFFVKIQNGVLAATPLFIVLVFVEITDLIFAVDSIPAILAITTDTFIVFTSNVFAILGLSSLYFALAGMINLFRFLHIGLSFILIFIVLKMVLSDVYKIPIEYALVAVLSILLTSIAASLPLMPGLVFLLIAAYCFLRGSKKYLFWLTRHKRFGQPIRDFNKKRGITKRHKVILTITVIPAILISALVVANELWLKIAVSAVAIFVLIIIWSFKTKEHAEIFKN